MVWGPFGKMIRIGQRCRGNDGGDKSTNSRNTGRGVSFEKFAKI